MKYLSVLLSFAFSALLFNSCQSNDDQLISDNSISESNDINGHPNNSKYIYPSSEDQLISSFIACLNEHGIEVKISDRYPNHSFLSEIDPNELSRFVDELENELDSKYPELDFDMKFTDEDINYYLETNYSVDFRDVYNTNMKPVMSCVVPIENSSVFGFDRKFNEKESKFIDDYMSLNNFIVYVCGNLDDLYDIKKAQCQKIRDLDMKYAFFIFKVNCARMAYSDAEKALFTEMKRINDAYTNCISKIK